MFVHPRQFGGDIPGGQLLESRKSNNSTLAITYEDFQAVFEAYMASTASWYCYLRILF
jgi:hypothetical protein